MGGSVWSVLLNMSTQCITEPLCILHNVHSAAITGSHLHVSLTDTTIFQTKYTNVCIVSVCILYMNQQFKQLFTVEAQQRLSTICLDLPNAVFEKLNGRHFHISQLISMRFEQRIFYIQ